MSTPSVASRPLLRVSTPCDISADDLARHGYGGVVLNFGTTLISSVHWAKQVAHRSNEAGLEVWIDVSHFPGNEKNELQRQQLVFNGNEPRVEASASTLINHFDEHNVTTVTEELHHFGPSAITGVLCRYQWREIEKAKSSTLPPFPWTPHLEDVFSPSELHALNDNTGDEAARIRQEYWQQLAELAESCFQRPLEDWCFENNMACIIQPVRTEWCALQMTDVLLARLSAHQPDRPFPYMLTKATPAKQLQQFYLLLHAGARRFQIHCSSYSFSLGAKLLNQSIAHALEEIAPLQNTTPVGVLFPARSAQTHYHPQGHRLTRWVSEDLEMTTALLHDLHFDWRFVTEQQLGAGTIKESTLHLGDASSELKMIVVPSITALGPSSWTRLEEFVHHGGKVACLGLLPRWSENGRDRNFEEQVGKAALVVVEDVFEAYAALENEEPLPPTIGFPVFREHTSGGRLCSYQPRLNPDAVDAALRVRQILHESLTPNFESQSSQILYSHSTTKSVDSFLVWNAGDVPQSVRMSLRPTEVDALDRTQIDIADIATQSVRKLCEWMPYPGEQGGGLGLTLELAAGQAQWVKLSRRIMPTLQRIERATFDITLCENDIVRGFTRHNGSPRVALRHKHKLQWFEGQATILPSPILLDDWEEAGMEYSHSVQLPASWRNCCVFLEVAPVDATIAVKINGRDCGARFIAPLRFDITTALDFAMENIIMLQLESYDDAEPTVLARLTPYPVVEVQLNHDDPAKESTQ